ncbi:MAG TPA: TraR/DksA family transcriptional regulator [Acidimicrobiales bacterium]|jgi:RNA polymerase-binding protein DksA|nr:TraR/DksA family transcriptional regulator [Acidimicrobiales bacterium]
MTSTDATTAGLRSLLEEERDSLRARLSELGYGAVGLNYDSNFADSSQVTAERGEAEALAAKLQETLAEVEHAIGKLDSATYGYCEACGKPIGAARLEAKPAARYCIDCASKR